ncbi:bifunctional PIG-L family deacetylase/class I SAM-dependent methyltransferase [Rothia uropygioeca]|uniref:bifunctional PIG-L family deacetylase/class I SAM-dependent methyltransferase n=1 Tax=Kocuria sp. 257 TaxID=2021970 RepID=UPI001013982D|nr:bifunctional PIG-L family deacetylase/class I SAM-dependent methyltransferase [Kocuria sp. 257]
MSPQRAPRFRHDDSGTPESVWSSEPLLATAEKLSLEPFDRLVAVAAHPDDETLTAAGLIVTASARGMEIDIVVATAGEASHPNSPTHDPADLRSIREGEIREAVLTLAPHARVHLLDLGDSHLAKSQTELVNVLVDLLGPSASRTLVVSTWRGDGHTDHEAAARAASIAAWRTDATHLEAPLWLWHWGTPSDVAACAAQQPLVRFDLDDEVREVKRAALSKHRSQTEPLGPEEGNEALLSAEVLAHFDRGFELFLAPERGEVSPFDELHRFSEDPWETKSSWYEQRKRALTLAALPRPQYGTVLELGCSVGTLARDLLTRCNSVLAVDESADALARARDATVSDRIEWVRASVPEEWGEAVLGRHFDLVVLSEIGYFLSPGRLSRLGELIAASGTSTVLACHWTHPIMGWPMRAAGVHRILDEKLDLPRAVTIADPDFELALWTADKSSRTAMS